MNDARSREAVLQFLDYCKNKGLMKPPTAEARKAAVNQVLGILSEEEASDVATIDLDAVMSRFQNLHGTRYTIDSLRTYKARVKNSILDFLRFRENPMDFKPTPGTSKLSKSKKQEKVGADTDSGHAQQASRISSIPLMTASTLPIQIRQDLTVLIHGLPFDLSGSEATKIANVVLALAGVSGISSPPQGAGGA
jgi:hypothetical protein